MRRQIQLGDGRVAIVVDIVVFRVGFWAGSAGVAMCARLAPQAPVVIVGVVTAFAAHILRADAGQRLAFGIVKSGFGLFPSGSDLFIGAIGCMQTRHSRQAAGNRVSRLGFGPGDTRGAFSCGAGALGPGVVGVGVQFRYRQLFSGEDYLVHGAGKEHQLIVDAAHTVVLRLIVSVDVGIGFQQVDQAPLGLGGIDRVIALIARIGNKIQLYLMIGPVVYRAREHISLAAMLLKVAVHVQLQVAVGVVAKGKGV